MSPVLLLQTISSYLERHLRKHLMCCLITDLHDRLKLSNGKNVICTCFLVERKDIMRVQVGHNAHSCMPSEHAAREHGCLCSDPEWILLAICGTYIRRGCKAVIGACPPVRCLKQYHPDHTSSSCCSAHNQFWRCRRKRRASSRRRSTGLPAPR